MANYNITKTSKGWMITKDGERLAGLYKREQFALMALAFGLWRNLEIDELVTEDMIAAAVADKLSDTERSTRKS